tara:strand:- start:1028 stop:1597 length:570 start_codon:yes stop_codon:yes gene_type:complete
MKNKNKPNKELLTNSYHSHIDTLLCASGFVDYEGVEHKIPHGLKVYYMYRYKRYNIHESLGYSYNESNKTVSKMLGLSLDTISKNYQPLLKLMGLLTTQGSFKDNDITYTVYGLSELKGWLINPKIKDTHTKTKDYKRKDKFTYEDMKIQEHNKKLAVTLRNQNKKQKVIDESRFHELIRIEHKYKQGE